MLRDSLLAAFKPIIAAAKGGGSLVMAQLTHAGRQTKNIIAEVPISSSDVGTGPLGGLVSIAPSSDVIAQSTPPLPCADVQQAAADDNR